MRGPAARRRARARAPSRRADSPVGKTERSAFFGGLTKHVDFLAIVLGALGAESRAEHGAESCLDRQAVFILAWRYGVS